MNGKIISISNSKGGVGKTTTTVNLGTALARQGYKVLCCDCDPQGNFSAALGLKPDTITTTIANLMMSVIEDNGSETESLTNCCIIHHNGLDIIPSNLKLSAVEISLISAMSRETILKKILTPLRLRYDFILLDCLPSLGMLTINALAACDSVIIPLEAHYLSYEGLELILRTISQVKRNINNGLTVEGIIFTKYQSHTNFCRSIRELVEREYGENIHIFKDMIGHSIRVAEASAVGVSIFDHDPQNSVAKAYQNIALEVAGHEK